MKHIWINPKELGYKNLSDYKSCRNCGTVKGKRSVLTLCHGKVRVGFTWVNISKILILEVMYS